MHHIETTLFCVQFVSDMIHEEKYILFVLHRSLDLFFVLTLHENMSTTAASFYFTMQIEIFYLSFFSAYISREILI